MYSGQMSFGCEWIGCSLHSVLQDYPKLSQSYYALLECLAQDHMTFISNIEPQVLLYILSTISEGLTALGKDSKICLVCFIKCLVHVQQKLFSALKCGFGICV